MSREDALFMSSLVDEYHFATGPMIIVESRGCRALESRVSTCKLHLHFTMPPILPPILPSELPHLIQATQLRHPSGKLLRQERVKSMRVLGWAASMHNLGCLRSNKIIRTSLSSPLPEKHYESCMKDLRKLHVSSIIIV